MNAEFDRVETQNFASQTQFIQPECIFQPYPLFGLLEGAALVYHTLSQYFSISLSIGSNRILFAKSNGLLFTLFL